MSVAVSNLVEHLRAWGFVPAGSHAADAWVHDGDGDGDDVRVCVTLGAEIGIELGGRRGTEALSVTWASVFEPQDAAEVLDLVAAATFGRARIVAQVRGGAPVGHRLEILADARWMPTPLGEAPAPRTWFRRWDEVVFANPPGDPAPARWGECGKLPSAPWVGMLEVSNTEPGTLTIDGELDLHPFKPKEVRGVVEAYVDACLERGVLELRLVHGKGIGNLRRTVHAFLDKHPAVAHYKLGGSGGGGWGATVVTLRPRTGRPESG